MHLDLTNCPGIIGADLVREVVIMCPRMRILLLGRRLPAATALARPRVARSGADFLFGNAGRARYARRGQHHA